MRVRFFHRYLICWLAAGVTGGCGSLEEKPPQAPANLGRTSADAVAEGDDETVDQSLPTDDGDRAPSSPSTHHTGDPIPASGKAGVEGLVGKEDDAPEQVDLEEESNPAEALAACTAIDWDDPEKEIVRSTFATLPLVQQGSETILFVPVDFAFTLLGQREDVSTLRGSLLTTTFEGTSDSRLGRNRAGAAATELSGTVTTTHATGDSRLALGSRDPSWSGVLCTVEPAVAIHNQLGEQDVAAQFDPPLPVGVLPNALATRYQEELGDGKTWGGITATITRSNDPDLTVGSVVTGSATLVPISPEFSTILEDGENVAIRTDLAFELRLQFGDPALTNALGLNPVTRYYFDEGRGEARVIVTESQREGQPPVVFLNN